MKKDANAPSLQGPPNPASAAPAADGGSGGAGEPKSGPGATSQVENKDKVDSQVIVTSVGTMYYNPLVDSLKQKPETPPGQLLAKLSKDLPPNVHSFRDPRHEQMRADLQKHQILFLTSYEERAAYSAAYSLLRETPFQELDKKALFPAREQEKDRADLDFAALARDEFFGENPQIVLVEINRACKFFDSTRDLPPAALGTLCDTLREHHSYVIVTVNEKLLEDGEATRELRAACGYYTVSHLRYLLTKEFQEEAGDLEKRLLAAYRGTMELQELYAAVTAQLANGATAFTRYLKELEELSTRPVEERKERLQRIQPAEVLRRNSEEYRAAAFLGTFFTNLRQHDFDQLLMVLLLGDTTHNEEHWSDRWERTGDDVFEACHLRPVTSPDGTWVIDFSEPYLRRELRTHFERHLPWYLRRQCRILQESGVLFAFDLSPAAVDGLVSLFVERAVVDPSGFGSRWLLDLVRGLKIQIGGKPPSDSPEETLVWLLEQLTTKAQLLGHFHGRLALLIREMLERETLRPTVSEFFEYLIAARQHDALLDVILSLARRLRFAPHFDPLVWMRRLLDQGSAAVKDGTAGQLVALARESGPRIYEFLAAIRNWLPEPGREPQRFSRSNREALEFPYSYCASVAATLTLERLGSWPSQHPLFYALPPEREAERREITALVQWILDPRGVEDDAPGKTATDEVRMGKVAALVEHWAWILEGNLDGRGAPEGRELFAEILEEIASRTGAAEQSWLRRSWEHFREECLDAANVEKADAITRRLLVSRGERLLLVKRRFSEIAKQQLERAGGIAS